MCCSRVCARGSRVCQSPADPWSLSIPRARRRPNEATQDQAAHAPGICALTKEHHPDNGHCRRRYALVKAVSRLQTAALLEVGPRVRIPLAPGESPRTIGPARAGAVGIKFALGGGRVRLRKENHVVRQSADFPTAGPTVRILLAPTVSQRQRPAGCSAPHSCQTPD